MQQRHNREQDKFRDFFTKELNTTKAERVQVEKENQQLEKKRDRNNTKKETLAFSVRFDKQLISA